MPENMEIKYKSSGFISARKKMAAVLDVLYGRISTCAAAMLLKVSRTAVWGWKRKFISAGLEALKPKARGRNRRGYGSGPDGQVNMFRALLEKMKKRNTALELKNAKLEAELFLMKKAMEIHIKEKKKAGKKPHAEKALKAVILDRALWAGKKGIGRRDFCRISGMAPSVIYDWLKKQREGRLKNKKPGPVKKEHIISPLAELKVLSLAHEYRGMDSNWRVGEMAQISETSTRRIRVKFRKITGKTDKIPKKHDKQVVCLFLHVIWSLDSMVIRSKNGKLHLLMVLEERSRRILDFTVCEKINAMVTTDLLTGAVRKCNAIPLVVKFDRGSEFNNSKMRDLLFTNKVMPLPCPKSSPFYNGKYERSNRIFKSRIRALRVYSPEKIRQAVNEAVDMVNCMPRRMFRGYNSWRVYKESTVFDEAKRHGIAEIVFKKMEMIIAEGEKRTDRLDTLRKAVESTLIDMGLIRITDKKERVSYLGITIRDVVRLVKLEPNSGREHNKWEPGDFTLEDIKQQYTTKEIKDMFGFVPRTKPVSRITNSQDVPSDGTMNDEKKFFKIYLPD